MKSKGLYGITPLKPRGNNYCAGSDVKPLIDACQDMAVGQCVSREGVLSLPSLYGSGPPTDIVMFEFALKMPEYPFLLLATAGDIHRSNRIKHV